MHRYLRFVASFKRVAHLAKKSRFEQFVGKQRRLERKFLGISEAELLRFDCGGLFSIQGRFRLINLNLSRLMEH